MPNFWQGTEAGRIGSTAVPALDDIIITEKNVYPGDGITPLNQLTPAYDAYGTAAQGDAILAAQIANLAGRISPTRTAQRQWIGLITTCTLPGIMRIEQALTPGVVTLTLDAAVVGGTGVVITATVGGTIVYQNVIIAGTYELIDTNPTDNTGTPTAINDSSDVVWAITGTGGATFAGANLTVSMSDYVGSNFPPSIGSTVDIGATAQAGALLVNWGYTQKDNGDNLDHFAVRWMAGGTAPQSQTDGTSVPDVSAPAGQTRFSTQITGLAYGQQYSVTVWPIGASGNVGNSASVTQTTSVKDVTPPGSGTLTIQGVSQSSESIVYTPDPASPDIQKITLRRSNNSTISPATVSSGKPAGGGINASGSGLDIAVNAGQQIVFTDTNLNPGTPYAYSAFPTDTSGNLQTAPATAHATTASVPTSGQGNYGSIPSNYPREVLIDFSAGASVLDTNGGSSINVLGPSWAQQTQGPADPTNVDVITDPNNSSNKIMLMKSRRYAGFYKPGFWAYDSNGSALNYVDNDTSGLGWYNSRTQVLGHDDLTYGGCEFRVRIGDATGNIVTSSTWGGVLLGNNMKGGNGMWYPNKNKGAHWPQQELDLWEIFAAQEAQINNHFNCVGCSNTNGQTYNRWTFDTTQWTWVTCLFEPPPAGTNGDGRLRVWYNNVIRFDTDTPYVGSNLGVYQGRTVSNASMLLNPMMKKFFGMSLEWTHYYVPGSSPPVKQSTFTAADGAGTTQRKAASVLFDSIQLWRAPGY